MGTNLSIDEARLWSTLMETARFGATPKGGIRRLTLSDEDRQVREWLREAAEAIGLSVTVDAMGNMFAVRPGKDASRPPIAFGSHLDTQPAGGKFDGILGVLAGLEVMRTLSDAGYETEAPFCLVNWTNEEGARFAPAMMSSGVWAGELDAESALSATDNEGRVFREELRRIGYEGGIPIGAVGFAAFLELHIEQGPVLEAEELVIGVVTGGQGILWWDMTVTGRDSHAGTTPMPMRRDAMAALSEITLLVERIALDNAPAGVGTVGEVQVLPGSRNTIPGTTHARGEFRHPDGETLKAMEARFLKEAGEIAARRNVEVDIRRIWLKEPVTFHPTCVEAVEGATKAAGYPYRKMISGAGHDAFYAASKAPTSMIFVPCKDGLSHNELEEAKREDCAAGAQVLLGALLALDEALSGTGAGGA